MPGRENDRRKEIKGYTPEEMTSELGRLRAEMVKLRTQAVTEKVENNARFRQVRRDIARILTTRTAKAAKA